MKNSHENDFFKEIANRYVDAYGQELQQELKQQNIQYTTPILDERVHRRVSMHKVKRVALGISALAACLLIVMTSSLLRYNQKSNITPNVKPTPPVIPLSFVLPVNLSVSGTEQDQEQSIYRLHDSLQDDVVLVLEETDRNINDEDMTAVKINGYRAYTRKTADYNLLIFKKNGILYTLTCRYDVSTLVELGKNIL
ncbi:MAG: hypothetical protein BGN88_06685 [Clostridiales bacterium 43-6]|nr:MAG: hypothetical protein BGN88_06685 [Clostridiales bacterium 43-6]